jgi:hypothetical protein
MLQRDRTNARTLHAMLRCLLVVGQMQTGARSAEGP